MQPLRFRRFLGGCIVLWATTVVAAAQMDGGAVSSSKIAAEVFEHRDLKIRATTGRMSSVERELHSMSGVELDKSSTITCALYVTQRPDAATLSNLGRLGVAVIPDLFVPPVGERHPHGFFIAEVPIERLENLESIAAVVRVASLEHQLKPTADLARAMIKADLVQNGVGVTTRSGRGVNVAVADSGLDLTHADIPTPVEAYDVTDGPTIAQWSTNVANTNVDHGTHITSIVCGSGGLSFGRYKGIAPEARLYFYKVGNDANAQANEADLIKALNRAQLVGCRVFNLAYGGFDNTMDGSNPLCQAVDAADLFGMIVCCSAGNEADKKLHAGMPVAPNTVNSAAPLLSYQIGTFFALVPFSAAQQIEIVWRDDNSSDLNMSINCTNLGAGETFVLQSSGTSSRGTEYRRYVLTCNIPPNVFGLVQKNYLFTVTNSAASGQTPLVHGFRSAGNAGQFVTPLASNTIVYPGISDRALTIGAVTHRNQWINYQGQASGIAQTIGIATPYSSVGPRIDGVAKPDVTAPGDAMIAARDGTWANNALDIIDNDGFNLNGLGPANYYRRNGTSQSTAVAVGAVALLLEASPLLTTTQVKNALKSTASLAASPTNQDGSGIIDIRAAILSVEQKPSIWYLSPSFGIVGGSAFSASIVGRDFRTTSVVRWNGVPRPFTFVSSQRLDITISAGDLSSLGTSSVTVENIGAIGGGTSDASVFSVVSSGRLARGRAGDRFGSAVAAIGDLNGDGVGDFIVGSPGFDGYGVDSGCVRAISGANGRVLWNASGDNELDHLGTSVAAIGDITGDGIPDVAAGAPDDDNSGVNAGMVRLYSGANGAVILSKDGAGAGDAFGTAIAGGIDLNGDLVPDYVVGAPQQLSSGAGYMIAYSGAGGAVITQVAGISADDGFGASLAVIADVDGSGAGDILVGARPISGAPGYAFCRSGSTGAAIHTFLSPFAPTTFGRSVAALGDVDFDGTPDIAIGGGSLQGFAGAVVFSGLTGSLLRTLYAGQTGDDFASSIAGAGDADDDGFVDLLIGSPQTTAGGAGRIDVFSTTDLLITKTTVGAAATSDYGASVAFAGDIDLNGVVDRLIGSPGDLSNGADSGVVRVDFGPSPAAYRGSRHDFLMTTAVGFGSPLTSGGGVDRKNAISFDFLTIRFYSPNGIWNFTTPFLVAQAFTTGFPPVPPLFFPELHVNTSGGLIIYGPTAPIFGPAYLPPGGTTIAFSVPSIGAPFSVNLQAITVSPFAPNGFFVATDAHELILM